MLSDIKITDAGDIACDIDGLPIIITDLEVVSQDVKHAILESGFLPVLLAERSTILRNSIYNQIILLVEDDARIIPGTVQIEELEQGVFVLKAIADYGTFNIKLGV